MNNIIHLSDFHINPSLPAPEKHEIFSSLINAIKKQKLEKIILVYTGDVIDSGPRQFNPPASLSTLEKKQQWNSYAKEAYKKAADYFEYMTRELEIDNNHIIIAIGNHDVNQHDDDKLSFTCPIKNHADIQYGKGRFEAVSTFFEDMKYQFSSCGNHFREIDGFNFVIANTQWVDKEDDQVGKLCLNCNNLSDVFESHKNRLLQTKEDSGKLHNIFVAHNPERDCCEYSCYPYKENEYVYLEKKIREYCGIRLFGDKHTTDSNNQTYVAGAPFYNERIAYGIHTFNDFGDYSHKTINYDKDQKEWYTKQESESIKEILQCSEKSLKDEAFKYLKLDYAYIDQKVNNVIDFDSIRMSDPWSNLEDLFSSYVSIRIPNNEGPGKPVSYSGIFNTVTSYIQNTKNKICLTVKGSAASGKSVFLSLLYLNLLYECSNDQIACIPFYINLESVIDQTIKDKTDQNIRVKPAFCIDNTEFFNEVKERVKKYFEEAEMICKKYNQDAVFLVDGIKQFEFYDNFNIEETVASLLTKYLDNGFIHTAILSISVDNILNLSYTSLFNRKESEYIAYFNDIYVSKIQTNNIESIDTNPVQLNYKLKSFIKAYCLLNDYGEDAVDDVIATIERLRIPYVNTGMMSIAIKKLVSKTTTPIFELIHDYYFGSIGATHNLISLYARVCYALYYDNKNYTAIKISEEQLGYRIFNKIIRHNLLSKMLIAIHYCNQITKKRTQSAAGDTLSPRTLQVLNRLYESEMCSFIIGYLKLKNSAEKLKAFEDRYYDQLNFAGKSTITYLIGRIVDNNEELRNILKNEEDKLRKSKKPSARNSMEYYEYCVAKRSIAVSRLARNIDSFLSPNNYFDQLLSDDNERRINRKFYLQFYGDRKKAQIEPSRDVIMPGLDFYNTYNLLAVKVIKSNVLKEKGNLLELELFTLCDLIQVHLDCPKITDWSRENGTKEYCGNDDRRPASFFYNDRYASKSANRAISVLKLMDNQITLYLNSTTPPQNARKYRQYLHVRQDQFQDALNSLENNKAIIPYDVNSLLNDLTALSNVKKTGWHISDASNKIDDDQMSKIFNDKNCLETTLEHVYDSFLIGLLYLPNKVPGDSKYNKDKILKTIMIHDLGEAYTKDYPPNYIHRENIRIEENRRCVNIFLSGTHENTATMTEYLELWNEWHLYDKFHNTSNINIRIAAEIDKIQMIYKLFTLLSQDILQLPDNRIKDFFDSSTYISTPIGIHIFNTLIANNSAFKEVANKNGIQLKEIWVSH